MKDIYQQINKWCIESKSTCFCYRCCFLMKISAVFGFSMYDCWYWLRWYLDKYVLQNITLRIHRIACIICLILLKIHIKLVVIPRKILNLNFIIKVKFKHFWFWKHLTNLAGKLGISETQIYLWRLPLEKFLLHHQAELFNIQKFHLVDTFSL